MPSKIRRRLIVAGLIPILFLIISRTTTELLVVSIFMLLLFVQKPLNVWYRRFPGPSWAKFLFLYVILNVFVFETLFWLSSYLGCVPDPDLLHNQLFWDWIYGIGFYGGLGVAWTVIRTFYGFDYRDAFIIQVVYGVFVEQLGSVFLAGLATFPLGILLWLYVFVIYGSIAASPFVIADDNVKKHHVWRDYFFALVLLFALGLTISAIWGSVIQLSVGRPEQMPICERPFW
jgi:hypothetical protein